MTDEQTKAEYYKFHVGDGKDWDSKAVLLKEAIKSARLRNSKVSWYRKLKKSQLYRVVQKDMK